MLLSQRQREVVQYNTMSTMSMRMVVRLLVARTIANIMWQEDKQAL